jgi:hypothetical protein
MSLWGGNDAQSNAVKFSVVDTKYKTGSNTYANTTSGAFVNGVAVGTFGISPAETSATSGRITHAGWVKATYGTGPVTNVVATGGSGYTNTDLLKVSGGTVNAAATVTTNSTGGNLVFTFTNYGTGFINVASSTVAVTNSTGGTTAGTGATFTLTLGGRAGRKSYQTLVAMSSLQSNNSIIS